MSTIWGCDWCGHREEQKERPKGWIEKGGEDLCPECYCSQCKNKIDPDVCHCGQSKEFHRWETHSFVPMGCSCGRSSG